MTKRPHEDFIEMELRHIRDGEARIARQEAIVTKLDLSKNADLALSARDLLDRFHEFLAIARERLDYLRRKQRDETP